ncbi:MAG: hypothetical protein ABEJ79_07450 [Halolamina sp.]
MNESMASNGTSDDSKFYFPAMTLSGSRRRIEETVDQLFDFHGVILIPESYND